MQSIQPTADTASRVTVQTFEVPESLRQSMIVAIGQKLKNKKSQGPDRLFTEIFQLKQELFTDAAMELWNATRIIVHVPSLIRSGLLVPVYKRKGDPSLPTNHIPICLISSFRKLICTTLTLELLKVYPHSEPNQWGFQSWTNTKCAVAFAVNTLRASLPREAVLDLWKAYDFVPRQRLQTMLYDRLSVMFRPLLRPIQLQTKQQKSSACDPRWLVHHKGILRAHFYSIYSWIAFWEGSIQRGHKDWWPYFWMMF